MSKQKQTFTLTDNKFVVNQQDNNSVKGEIIQYLIRKKPSTGKIFIKNGHTFPSDWNWKIKDAIYYKDGVKYSGSLAKRIRKYLTLRHNISLTNEEMGEIGEILRVAYNKSRPLICQFVNHFNWKAGDFGDGDSCFWTTSQQAKDLLVKNGARPILFYNENGKGVGRAITMLQNNCLIIFNAYGLNLCE